MTPLPEQLESADSNNIQQALSQWDAAPVTHQQVDQVREYELSAMQPSEGTQQLSNSTPASAPYSQAASPTHSTPRHGRNASTDQPVFHSPKHAPHSSDQAEACSSLAHKLPSQEAALDEAFPTIRKITPVGSPDKETLHGGVSLANLLQADQTYAGNKSQVQTLPECNTITSTSISFALAAAPLPNAMIVRQHYLCLNRQEVMLRCTGVMCRDSSQDKGHALVAVYRAGDMHAHELHFTRVDLPCIKKRKGLWMSPMILPF